MPKSSQEPKKRKATSKDKSSGGVAKKKRAPPKRKPMTAEEKANHRRLLFSRKKSAVIAAQSNACVLQKRPLQRLVRACFKNWVGMGNMSISVESIEHIRQYAEFMMNKLLRESQEIMVRNTTRRKEGKQVHGVRVGLKHVDQALANSVFENSAKIAYAFYNHE